MKLHHQTVLMLCVIFCGGVTCTTLPASEPEPGIKFNFGWRFALGDHAHAINPTYDDADWQLVDLPHDWAIAGPFDPHLGSGTGMLPWKGEGWYRKHFTLPGDAMGKRLLLTFDGVMANPEVFLNGIKIGSWRYGYNSFWVDGTDAIRHTGDNVLVVHADTRQHDSRWYPGAGIYRKVTMRLVNPVHIPVWGVVVTTPEVEHDTAKVRVSVDVENFSATNQTVVAETVIRNPMGDEVAQAQTSITLATGEKRAASADLIVKSIVRWDVDDPRLYTAVTRLLVDGNQVDHQTTPFGIRTFEWTADDGFHLNGRRLQIFGVNLHHDHGPLGAAFFPRAMQRQLEIMKQMGVNALRTSHNAPAPEVLDLCDRMGIVVFNELFDKYGPTAGVRCSTADYVNNYAAEEVTNFVLRDRNHPCVMLWSIGNEIPDILGNRDGHAPEHVAKMASYFKQLDPTRPTTMGSHMTVSVEPGKHVWDALDTSGWNYSEKYLAARRTYPKMPLIYSESASAFSTRGAYKLEHAKSKTDWGTDGLITAYEQAAASWADIPEKEFERMNKHNFVSGEFVWTGFDYLGEPTPFSGGHKTADGREARSSYFGIVDLVGLPKDRYYLYRSHWRPEETTVHLTPHWNWSGHEEEYIPVTVYTNGDEAELFLNGKSQGRRAKVRPELMKLDNFAFGRPVTASSEEIKQDARGNVLAENLANKAVDGVESTRWCASAGTFPQTWQVDLQQIQNFGVIRIDWEQPAFNYQFDIETSGDAKVWSKLEAKPRNTDRQTLIVFEPLRAQHVRLNITDATRNHWASIYEFAISKTASNVAIPASNVASPYYDIVDAYRLRWLNVAYVRGELKVVAYKDGKQIGEASVRSAGPAEKIRLIPDRSVLQADGMDLCYVTVEIADSNGNVCPLAMNDIAFAVQGPATLIGVDNGDPMGMNSFTDQTHPVFYGRAIAILRTRQNESGKIVLTANANGLTSSNIQIESKSISNDDSR